MYMEKVADTMNTETMREYKNVLAENLAQKIEEDPDILELNRISGDLITEMVTKTPDDLLRQVIRENLAMNSRQTVEEFKGTLDEVKEVIDGLDEFQAEIYKTCLEAGMASVRDLWTRYEPIFIELIGEMNDGDLKSLWMNAAKISGFIHRGGLTGSPLEDYTDILVETWDATWTMATMEMSKRALQADPTNS